MIAFEKHCSMALAAFYQQIESLAGFRPAVDIVPEKHVDRMRRPATRQIGVNHGKQLLEQVRAAVGVTNGIRSGPLPVVVACSCLCGIAKISAFFAMSFSGNFLGHQ